MTDTAHQPDQRGRTRITTRALEWVVAQITADAFGVERKKVSTDVDDAGGNLSLRVRTPLRVPSLTQITDNPSVVDAGGGPILEKTAAAQQQIRSEVQHITGSTVARVLVEITGADIRPHRRVR